MAWHITKDHIGTDQAGTKSISGDDINLPYKYRFRLIDDDGAAYYTGLSTDEDFDPLDEFGEPFAGCTAIQYRDGGKWIYL